MTILPQNWPKHNLFRYLFKFSLFFSSPNFQIYHNKWQIEFVLWVDSFIPCVFSCVLSCVLTSYLFYPYFCCCYYSYIDAWSRRSIYSLWSYLPWIGKLKRGRFAQAKYEYFFLNHTPPQYLHRRILRIPAPFLVACLGRGISQSWKRSRRPLKDGSLDVKRSPSRALRIRLILTA